jgi:hypothetical protein
VLRLPYYCGKWYSSEWDVSLQFGNKPYIYIHNPVAGLMCDPSKKSGNIFGITIQHKRMNHALAVSITYPSKIDTLWLFTHL